MITYERSDGWSCGSALSLLSSLCVMFFPTVLMSQSDRPASMSRAVTRVDVPINRAIFIFYSFCFLPMVSQDHSLIFFLLYQ
jgi:hypothetical protein